MENHCCCVSLNRLETNQCCHVCKEWRLTSVAMCVQNRDQPVLPCLHRMETNQCSRVCKKMEANQCRHVYTEWRLTSVGMVVQGTIHSAPSCRHWRWAMKSAASSTSPSWMPPSCVSGFQSLLPCDLCVCVCHCVRACTLVCAYVRIHVCVCMHNVIYCFCIWAVFSS